MGSSFDILLILILFGLLAYGQEIPTITFQEDGNYTTETFMLYKSQIPDISGNFSLCFRAKWKYFRGKRNFLVSYANKDTDNALKSSYVQLQSGKRYLEICKHKFFTRECVQIGMDQQEMEAFDHVCTTFQTVQTGRNTIESKISGYLNGLLAKEVSVDIPMETYVPLRGGGTLVIGQDQDHLGGNFDSDQAFSGEITQFSIYNRILNPQETKGVAKCQIQIQKDIIVGWDLEKNWDLNHVTIEYSELSHLCIIDPLLRKFIVSKAISYANFKSICDKIGGELPVPKSRQDLRNIHTENKKAFDSLKDASCQVSPTTVHFNLGIYLENNGRWFDPYGNATLKSTDTLFSRARPFDDNEKCAYAWGNSMETNDCEDNFACGICQLPARQTMKLKGMCHEGVMDHQHYDLDYHVFGHRNGKPHFRLVLKKK